ncbi:hypothetical protein D5H75_17150 [Bailinhaonella thermotolerans]|uniref:Uncharacterized protein n=1 Tax=Bailinhaonella thermotolerans TaxID=1070861 RepID=A0A3A4BD58_9ACTN|nr:hypothetical protein D5H75_17150 [Bailinhaonella thermotolerans]
MTPHVPDTPTTQITVKGSLANSGGAADVSTAQIRLRYSNRPFLDRGEIDAYVRGAGRLDTVLWSPNFPVARLGSGQRLTWSLSITPRQLGISRFGAYPLSVELVDAAGRQLAVQRTSLTYFPKDHKVAKTRVAWLLPLVDRPHRGDDANFVDDRLAADLASGGRLSDLVGAAGQAPKPKTLTWYVDPGLLDDAQALTRPHTLREGDDAEQKPANTAASSWLDAVRRATASSDVIAAPYADPDMAALAHNGLDGMAAQAVSDGQRVATAALGRPPATGTAWPADGALDLDTLDVLAVNGAKTVVLYDSVLPPATPPNHTPDSIAQLQSVQGPVKALLADSAISQTVGGDTRSPGTAALALQRFLAETATLTGEQPSISRSVVIAPPRRWNPSPAFLTELLKTSASAPWLRQVGLDELTKPPADYKPVPRAGLAYSSQNELSRKIMTQIKRVRSDADRTVAVSVKGTHVFDRALLRLTSSAWRGRGGDTRVRPVADRVADAVTARTEQVRIINKQKPTLAGNDGTVPVTISNRHKEPVRLKLKVTSSNPHRLRVTEDSREITIAAEASHTAHVRLKAYANGETPITLQLLTPEGQRYGKPVVLRLSATGYTTIALFLIGGALAVMALAVISRFLRRRRDAATTESGAPVEPESPSAPMPDAPQGAAAPGAPAPAAPAAPGAQPYAPPGAPAAPGGPARAVPPAPSAGPGNYAPAGPDPQVWPPVEDPQVWPPVEDPQVWPPVGEEPGGRRRSAPGGATETDSSRAGGQWPDSRPMTGGHTNGMAEPGSHHRGAPGRGPAPEGGRHASGENTDGVSESGRRPRE